MQSSWLGQRSLTPLTRVRVPAWEHFFSFVFFALFFLSFCSFLFYFSFHYEQIHPYRLYRLLYSQLQCVYLRFSLSLIFFQLLLFYSVFFILQLIHGFICTLERHKLDALQLKIVKNAQILKLYVLNYNSVISVFVTVVKQEVEFCKPTGWRKLHLCNEYELTLVFSIYS